MAWPTNLARGSTNAFSPESMISKNLMDQALKSDRDRIATLSRQASISDSDSDSDSDDEKTTSPSQKTVTNHFSHKNFNNKPTIATIKAERTSLLFKNIKTGPNRKESSLRHIFFPCCCIQ